MTAEGWRPRRSWASLLTALLLPRTASAARVTVAEGVLEGGRERGVWSFKGVPFAAPPVGPLRWKPPAPPVAWRGVRAATAFGPRAMQRPIFGDMNFRSSGMGEDCLYLNVWTPDPKAAATRPVLVYFYGGGFQAGDGSEPRYDGAALAAKGLVTVTVNYRLGVFGFLALPALSAESPRRASGNYGLLDQAAALRWVRANIAAFGGDPARITIAGESAGSSSVSALMASPLTRDLIAGAIGESGSVVDRHSTHTLAETEAAGEKFVAGLGLGGSPTLNALRSLSATVLLEATGKEGAPWFWTNVDGEFLPKSAAEIYAAGEQARVPLLAGTNTAEGGAGWFLGDHPRTVSGFQDAVRTHYGDRAEELLRVYPATTDAEAVIAARDLASDRFIAFSTWLWLDLATRTGGRPTYYYLYAHPRPPMRAEMGDARPGLAGGVIRGGKGAPPPPPEGASHSAEIEYALGNLGTNLVYAWTPDDEAVSATFQAYVLNFVRTGDPNGPGVPAWPVYGSGQRQTIDVVTRTEPDLARARYEVLATLPSIR